MNVRTLAAIGLSATVIGHAHAAIVLVSHHRTVTASASGTDPEGRPVSDSEDHTAPDTGLWSRTADAFAPTASGGGASASASQTSSLLFGATATATVSCSTAGSRASFGANAFASSRFTMVVDIVDESATCLLQFSNVSVGPDFDLTGPRFELTRDSTIVAQYTRNWATSTFPSSISLQLDPGRYTFVVSDTRGEPVSSFITQRHRVDAAIQIVPIPGPTSTVAMAIAGSFLAAHRRRASNRRR